MPSSLTPPEQVAARITRHPVLPSLSPNKIGLRYGLISELNSPPVLSPVNASLPPHGKSTHDSGPVWLARPFTVRLFHSLLIADFNRRFLGAQRPPLHRQQSCLSLPKGPHSEM